MPEKLSRLSKYIGLFIFFIGVFLLGLTFFFAYKLYVNAQDLLGINNIKSIAEGLKQAPALGFKFLFLLVMGYVASLLASKGIELYTTARD